MAPHKTPPTTAAAKLAVNCSAARPQAFFWRPSSTAASRAHIMTSGRKYGWMPTAKKASTGMAQGNLAVPLCRF